LDGQPMFSSTGGDQLIYHQNGNQVSWNFSLELRRTEDQP
jgi:hypothetical protein